jgi:WD40 repeat protein
MSTPLRSPFVGLIPYDADSRRYFCGRYKEIDLVTAAATSTRLSIVYGPSGGGKSSVLCAGVIPNLEEQTQFIDDDDNDVTPDVPDRVVVLIRQQWSADPFAAICSAINETFPQYQFPHAWFTQPGGSSASRIPQLILILDQFEDLFIQHPVINSTPPATMLDLARRMRAGETLDITSTGLRVAISLIALLNDPGAPVNVVFSLREDLLASLDVFKGLLPDLFGTLLRIELMNEDTVRNVIVKPLQRWAKDHPDQPCAAQPALIDAIIADTALHQREPVRNTSASHRFETPFLALTLERLWVDDIEKPNGKELKVSTFAGLGGAKGIRSAFVEDSLKRHLKDSRQRRWFTEAARSLVSRTQKFPLASTELVDVITTNLNGTKLVPPTVAELTALLRTFLPDRLIRELPLNDKTDAADGKFEIAHDSLAGDIFAWRAGQVATIEQQAQRDRDRRRLLTSLALLIGALAFGLIMLRQRVIAVKARDDAKQATINATKARDDAKIAEKAALEANDRLKQQTAEAQKARDEAKASAAAANAANEQSKRFAKKSANDSFNATLQNNLVLRVSAAFALLDKSKPIRDLFAIRNDAEDNLDAIDGINYNYLDNVPKLEAKAKTAKAELKKANDKIKEIINARRAEQFTDSRASLIEYGARLYHGSGVQTASFGPPGTAAADLLITASYGRNSAFLINVNSLPFGRLDKTALSAGSAQRIEIPALLIRENDTKSRVLKDARFSLDGSQAAFASEEGKIYTFDTATLSATGSWNAHGNVILSIAYGPDNWLASAGADSRVVLRNSRAPNAAEQSLTTTDGVPSYVDFNHQTGANLRLLVSCREGKLLICKPGNALTAITQLNLQSSVNRATYSAKDKWITACAGANAYLIDASNPPREPKPIPVKTAGASGIDIAARHSVVSPDEKHLAICGEDGVIRLIEIATITPEKPGGKPAFLSLHDAAVNYAAWSPDGRYLATASDDDTAIIWDTLAVPAAPVARLIGHLHRLHQVNWHSSGKYLITASHDDFARIWKFEPKR